MLKTTTLAQIATYLKIKQADLETAIKDEKEVDLVIDAALTVLTEPEVTTLKTNEYTRGKVTGVEMAVKDAKEKHGLDFTGKTIDGLVENIKTKTLVEAKITPDAKVVELETKLKAVQTNYATLEDQVKSKGEEVESLRLHTDLYKNVPAGTILEPDEVIHVMKSKGYDFKRENGALVAFKDGKALTDKVSNNLPVKDVITGFVTERKLAIATKAAPDGRGGGDGNHAAGMTKLSELKKKYQDEGKSELSQDFQAEVAQLKKDNPEFDLSK